MKRKADKINKPKIVRAIIDDKGKLHPYSIAYSPDETITWAVKNEDGTLRPLTAEEKADYTPAAPKPKKGRVTPPKSKIKSEDTSSDDSNSYYEDDSDEDDDDGATLLHIATKEQDIEKMQQLLENDSDVNEIDDSGYTALHFAVNRKNIESMELLVKHGANINAVTDSDETALHFAAENGDLKTIKWLVNHGANINKAREDSKTALHVAMENEHIEVSDWLIEQEIQTETAETIDPSPPQIVKALEDTQGNLRSWTESSSSSEKQVKAVKNADGTLRPLTAEEEVIEALAELDHTPNDAIDAGDIEAIPPLAIAEENRDTPEEATHKLAPPYISYPLDPLNNGSYDITPSGLPSDESYETND